MLWKKLLGVYVAAILLFWGSFSASQETDNIDYKLNEEKARISLELEQLSKTITLSSYKSKALEDNILLLKKNTQSLRAALIQSTKRNRGIETQLNKSKNKLSRLRLQEIFLQSSLKERRTILANVLAALQKLGSNPPPVLLVTPEDALASIRSAMLLSKAELSIRDETRKIVIDLNNLKGVQVSIKAEKANLMVILEKSIEEKRRMELLIAGNDKLYQQDSRSLSEERLRTQKLAERATSLEELISNLDNQITSARELNKREQNNSLLKNNRVVSDKEKHQVFERPFADLKGKLEMPVDCKVLKWFGDTDSLGHKTFGVTCAAMPGAMVTTPVDGFVVYSGSFRSYGKMIIISPSAGYHVLISGMDTLNIDQGRFVFSGEPIGSLGTKRLVSANTLALETDALTVYIEFRKDGKPIDSRAWWSKNAFRKGEDDR